MTLTSLFGTRIILIDGDLVAALLEDERRRELTFLLARFVGALKSQRDRIAPLRLLVTLARPIGLVNVFIWPYDRDVVHTGDQIGLATGGDLDAALNALDRLLVGGTLGVLEAQGRHGSGLDRRPAEDPRPGGRPRHAAGRAAPLVAARFGGQSKPRLEL